MTSCRRPTSCCEHPSRLGGIARFAEDSPVEHNDRVGADHQRLRMPPRHGARFPLRVLHGQHLGRCSGEHFLDSVWLYHREPQPISRSSCSRRGEALARMI